MKTPNPADMVVHVDHELGELLRVGGLIQSGEYSDTHLEAPLREAFASHFRKLCEFFGVDRSLREYDDIRAFHYGVDGLWNETEVEIQNRLADADTLQAHVSGGRKERERMNREWGDKADTDLMVPKIREFLERAEEASWPFPDAQRELKGFGW